MESPFHIVLVEPEIPPNTGNIARLCGATGVTLHLVGRLGFSLDDRSLKRAGLDYWHAVRIFRWESLEGLCAQYPDARLVLTSTRGGTPYHRFSFAPHDFILFGNESRGLPAELLARHPGRTIRIPITGPVRSLNLSTSAGIVLYEALRQTGHLDGEPG
ncbi:MAG: tRNA (cytidine(34)-2'-O)-methyltransferase [Desulfuromonadia bacterium]